MAILAYVAVGILGKEARSASDGLRLHGVLPTLLYTPSMISNGLWSPGRWPRNEEMYIDYVYIQGIRQTLLSRATNNTNICQKKEKQQYIAVVTVRMFIEPPSTNNL